MSARLRNLKVTAKLTLIQFVAAAALVTVVALAVEQSLAAQDRARQVDSQIASIEALGTVHADMLTVRMDLLRLALAGADTKTTVAADMATDVVTLQSDWTAFENSDPNATNAQRSATWSAVQAWGQVRDRQAALPQAGDITGFNQLRDAEGTPAADAAFDQLDTIRTAEAQTASALVAGGDFDFRSSLITLLAVAIAGLAALVVLSRWIARSITIPLRRVLGVVQGLAEGRLDARTGTSRDEVGQLAVATDAGMTNLAGVLTDISAKVDFVAASSAHLSAVSVQLSSGAGESAAQAELVAAASEQISGSMGTIAAAGEEMTAVIRDRLLDGAGFGDRHRCGAHRPVCGCHGGASEDLLPVDR